jgi:hypothetical protein
MPYESRARLAIGTGKGLRLDEIPNGKGEFGLDVANPVPVDGIPTVKTYLSFLITLDSERIQFKRVGSWETPQFAGPTDGYDLFDQKGNLLTRIFVNAYAGGSSEKAPKGFIYFRPFKDDPTMLKVTAEIGEILKKDMATKADTVINLSRNLDQRIGSSGSKQTLTNWVLLIFFLLMFVTLVIFLIAHYGLRTILDAI